MIVLRFGQYVQTPDGLKLGDGWDIDCEYEDIACVDVLLRQPVWRCFFRGGGE